jgi:ABC-type polar amino acid transport system ATPase subunit
MARPKLLLVDEAKVGLSPLMMQELSRTTMRDIQRDGVAILLVEQNAAMALRLDAELPAGDRAHRRRRPALPPPPTPTPSASCHPRRQASL